MCHFCQKNIDVINFKNTELLSRFISGFYKIKPRKKTGLCAHHQKEIATAIKRARQMGLAHHQKEIATAIKRARQMGLMPYTPK